MGGGYKVFADVVELNMMSQRKNSTHELENTILVESKILKKDFLRHPLSIAQTTLVRHRW